jgi:hypothetical protein
MATSNVQTIEPGTGWVEITAADGVNGLVQNLGAPCAYAESATTIGASVVGHRLTMDRAFPKQSTDKAFVRAGSKAAIISFTESV